MPARGSISCASPTRCGGSKQKKGIVPIAGESADMSIGQDCIFVAVNVSDETPDPAVLARARASGAPVVTLQLADAYARGAAFVRSEVATATAGLLMTINPFDEPNVKHAEDATSALLATYQQSKRLSFPEPHEETGGVRLTLSQAAQAHLDGAAATSFLRVIGRGDYFCLLAFLPPMSPGSLRRCRSSAGAPVFDASAPRCLAMGHGICTRPASFTRAARTTASS